MPLKDKSFEEIVKTEMDAGKPQAQAVAIAYSQTGKDKKNMAWRDRLNTLDERAKRGTEKYASKKDVRTGEDEASEEEHEIQFTELERKRDTLG